MIFWSAATTNFIKFLMVATKSQAAKIFTKICWIGNKNINLTKRKRSYWLMQWMFLLSISRLITFSHRQPLFAKSTIMNHTSSTNHIFLRACWSLWIYPSTLKKWFVPVTVAISKSSRDLISSGSTFVICILVIIWIIWIQTWSINFPINLEMSYDPWVICCSLCFLYQQFSFSRWVSWQHTAYNGHLCYFQLIQIP